MNILLIDDDKDLCYLTKTVLAKGGFEVAFFGNAEEGIAYARQNKPNLILMDVMLPGVGGADAVRELQKDSELKDIPIVFLTALITGKEEENINVNVDGLRYRTLGKPYEINKLLEVAREYVQ